MSGIPVRILGNGSEANVTRIGQLVTAPFAYDEVVAQTLSVNNQAYNFFEPIVGQQFVVTTILLTADSNVATSTDITVYESSSVSDTTVDKLILFVELLKNDYRDLIGLNLLITEGKYLNIKMDDNDVRVTVMGYYVPA